MQYKVKPFHLCSYGVTFAGDIGQCQRPSVEWIEVIPGVFVAYCERHIEPVKQAIEKNND